MARKSTNAAAGNPASGQPGGIPEQRVVHPFVPSRTSLDSRTGMIKQILLNMKRRSSSEQFAGVLLAGDPGVGKTQGINFLSRLLGLELITIEAPHIVEEHIINIPFIVYNPTANKETGGVTKGTISEEKGNGSEYDVVLADSHLFSQIQQARKVPDAEYIEKIYSSEQDLIGIYESLGGTRQKVGRLIAGARENYKVMLFFDEFFRQTSIRIRNMLRGILNNQIGNHLIPSDAYVIYATNLHDSGGSIDDIPMNTQFDQIDVDNPSKQEWFSWLVYKFEKDEHVKLNPKIINEFHHILDDEHISYKDALADIRTSPRRWEQLLLYVNGSIPVKDEADARSLMTNVKTNFRNYENGQHSDLADKVLDSVARLIEETSSVKISAHSVNAEEDWRETLDHQVKMKMKLGDHRKYVPVVAGLPGIGKTMEMRQVARRNHLLFVSVDCSTLSSDDTVGLPIPEIGEDKSKIKTHFSKPSLYIRITKAIEEEKQRYFASLKKAGKEDEIKDFEHRRWKYLILLDEMNRNKPNVFNALRRILLEKNFGPQADGTILSLPREAIMVAAINPHDVGAEQLTGHMKDVVDVIQGSGSWKKQIEYMDNEPLGDIEQGVHDMSLDFVKAFVDKFHTQDLTIGLDQRPFNLEIGGDVYISPREYTQLFNNIREYTQEEVTTIRENNPDNMSAEEMEDAEHELRSTIFKAFATTLKFILTKHSIEPHEFMHALKGWVMTTRDVDIGEGLFYERNKEVKMDLTEMLGEYMEGGHGLPPVTMNHEFINFLVHADKNKITEEFARLLLSKLKDHESVQKYLIGKDHPIKKLKDGNIIEDPSQKVSLFYNFFIQVLETLKQQEVPNDRYVAIGESVYEAYEQINSELKKAISRQDLSVFQEEIMEVMNSFEGFEL